MKAAEKKIDIKENELLKIDKDLLSILLKDKTTEKNLIWATDNYTKYGPRYNPKEPICIDLITSHNGSIIKPRVDKSKKDQQHRVRQKAEVFTPSWVCNKQNNLIDSEWFGKKNVFNQELNESWKTKRTKVVFSEKEGKRWFDYVELDRLEVSCGEAPYITSRYDTVSGNFIEVNNRIGILDRKLRVISENTNTKEDWITWAYRAVQSIYGYDWQGDNVLIARENILFDVSEFFEFKFKEKIETNHLIEFAKIIAWNIWQMDGVRFVVPDSCNKKTIVEETLFGKITHCTECEGCKKNNRLKHNGIYCKIMDWKIHKTTRFVDLLN